MKCKFSFRRAMSMALALIMVLSCVSGLTFGASAAGGLTQAEINALESKHNYHFLSFDADSTEATYKFTTNAWGVYGTVEERANSCGADCCVTSGLSFPFSDNSNFWIGTNGEPSYTDYAMPQVDDLIIQARIELNMDGSGLDPLTGTHQFLSLTSEGASYSFKHDPANDTVCYTAKSVVKDPYDPDGNFYIITFDASDLQGYNLKALRLNLWRNQTTSAQDSLFIDYFYIGSASTAPVAVDLYFKNAGAYEPYGVTYAPYGAELEKLVCSRKSADVGSYFKGTANHLDSLVQGSEAVTESGKYYAMDVGVYGDKTLRYDADKGYYIDMDVFTVGESYSITTSTASPLDITLVYDRSHSMVEPLYTGLSSTEAKTDTTNSLIPYGYSKDTLEAALAKLDTTKPTGYYVATSIINGGTTYDYGAYSQTYGSFVAYDAMRYYDDTPNDGVDNGVWQVNVSSDSAPKGNNIESTNHGYNVIKEGSYYLLTDGTKVELTQSTWMDIEEAIAVYYSRSTDTDWRAGNNSYYSGKKVQFMISKPRRSYAADAFYAILEELYAKAQTGVDIRVSVVGFGTGVYGAEVPYTEIIDGTEWNHRFSMWDNDGTPTFLYEGYDDTGINNYYTTDSWGDADTWNNTYKRYATTFKQKVLTLRDVSLSNENAAYNFQFLHDVIYDPYSFGITRTDKAMAKAEEFMDAMQEDASDNSKGIVVILTDGAPTTSVRFTPSVANTAIETANTLKDKYTVFTIGFMQDLDAGVEPKLITATDSNGYISGSNTAVTANTFLHLLSSNYPDATSMGTTSDNTDWGERSGDKNEDGTLINYYYAGNTGDELMSAINDIIGVTDTITGTSSPLAGNIEIRDTVTDEFTVTSVEYFKVPYLGDGKFAAETAISTDAYSSNWKTGSNSLTVKFTDENAFLQETAKDDGTYGYALRVRVYIEPNYDNTYGGNQIPTNEDGAGIYISDPAGETPEVPYEKPNANVEIKFDYDSDEGISENNPLGYGFHVHDYFMDLASTSYKYGLADIELCRFKGNEGYREVNTQIMSNMYTVSPDPEKAEFLGTFTMNVDNGGYIAEMDNTGWVKENYPQADDWGYTEDKEDLNATLTIAPKYNTEDSAGQPAVGNWTGTKYPNYYSPKFAVIDYGQTVRVHMDAEGPMYGWKDEETGKIKATGFILPSSSSELRMDEKYSALKYSPEGIMTDYREFAYKYVSPNGEKYDNDNIVDRTLTIIPANIIAYEQYHLPAVEHDHEHYLGHSYIKPTEGTVLIDFSKDSILSTTDDWAATRNDGKSSVWVDTDKGLLMGTISRTDDGVKMTNIAYDFGDITLTAGNIFELRLRVDSTAPMGTAEIFLTTDQQASFAQAYSMSATPNRVSEEYAIVRFAISDGKAFVGQTLKGLRIDPANNSAEGSYAIDYIYYGPAASAPSSYSGLTDSNTTYDVVGNGLLFNFDGDVAEAARYDTYAYGHTDFSTVDHWYFTGMSDAAITNGSLTSTIEASSGAFSIRTSPDSGTTYPLSYTVGENDVVEMRYKIEGTTATNNVGIQTFYRPVGGEMTKTAGANKANGEYQVLNVKLDAAGTTIDGLQFNFYNVPDGTLTVDYIYAGPADQAPSVQQPTNDKYTSWTTTGQNANWIQTHDNSAYHGFDTMVNYNANTTDSNNATYVANVGNTEGKTVKTEPITFTFKGTGFDIISRTGSDCGMMFVNLYKEDGTLVHQFLIDTYLASETLYQLPVVHYTGLDYGTYKVTIEAFYNGYMDHEATKVVTTTDDGEGTTSASHATRAAAMVITEDMARELLGIAEDASFTYIPSQTPAAMPRAMRGEVVTYEGDYNVYVDGVRIYNTLGTLSEEDADPIPYYTYMLADEINPGFMNVKDIILTAGSWVADGTDLEEEKNGVAYIAGVGSVDASATDKGVFLAASGSVYTDENGLLLKSDGEYLTLSCCGGKVMVDTTTPYTDPETGRTINCTYYHQHDGSSEWTKITDLTTLQSCVVFFEDSYNVSGPENEVYLTNGSGIAFSVGTAVKTYISIKSPNAAAVTLKAYKNGEWTEVAAVSVPNEQYYNLTDFAENGSLILMCSGTADDAVLSLCNLKFVGGTGSKNVSVSSELMYKAVCAIRSIETPDDGTGSETTGSVKINSANLSINQDVNVAYSVTVSENCTDPYMVFTFNGVDYIVRDYTVKEDGSLRFVFTGVTPETLGDNISATLYATCGSEVISDTVENYSVLTYCVNTLNRYPDNAELVALLSDLLVYGEKAQIYTGYKTDALVTDGLSLSPSTFETVTESKKTISGARSDIADWKNAGLYLENAMTMYFSFTAASTEGLSVEVSINGRTTTYTAENFVQQADGSYRIYFRGIMAYEFDDTVTAIFVKDGTQTGRTVTYSVNSYVRSYQDCGIAELAELARALYNYGTAAKAYSEK